jgi:hypothetical protein
MLDVLTLPVLALIIVGFGVYIWFAWVKDKDGRALNIPDDDEGDDSPRG